MTQKTSPPHAPATLTVKGRDIRMRTLGIVLLTAVSIWFIAVNTETVTIRLWIPLVTLPLWAVLAVTLLAGLALGVFLTRRRSTR
ncbi:LapA family protein [Streptomyces sp. NPDC052042]|uniref:LapA family protein n=1 Tax=Streptomyces sp. NPDC052042 TaxID=3365683 RepID=UPI0037D39D74